MSKKIELKTERLILRPVKSLMLLEIQEFACSYLVTGIMLEY